MDGEDLELEKLKLRKLRELQAKTARVEAERSRPHLPDPLKLVEGRLVGRGREVLEAALEQYPEAARLLVRELARLILEGKLPGQISGETLHQLFKVLGFPIRLETRIFYAEKGEVKSLAEKLREKISSQ